MTAASDCRVRASGQALRSREFPGRPESAGAARHWVTRCLPGCPAAGDAGLCVTELVANAVTHSRSRLPGGTVRVRLLIGAGVQVRIEVRDDGPLHDPGAPAAGPAAAAGRGLPEDGRGLAIVRALTGGNAGSDGSGLHWAVLHWAPLPAALPAEPGSPRPARVPAQRSACTAAPAVPPGGVLFPAAPGGVR